MINIRFLWSLWKFCFISLGVIFFVTSCAPTTPVERKPEVRRTCAQCHPELVAEFEIGVVHQPITEKNCEACHLPHGLVPVILMLQPVPAVCLPCHEDFKEADSKTSVHEPVSNGECESCHNPHNSEYPKLLTDPAKKLCFNCHEQEPFTRATVHAPLDEGCSECHVAHMADQQGLLTMSRDDLCASCHEVGSKEFNAAHQDFPVTTRCTNCHAQHSSSDPGLLREVVHPPVRNGDCNDCHEVQGSVIKELSFDEGLCLACHDDIPDMAQHAPVKEGECQECHDEHASEYFGMLAETPTRVCLNCCYARLRRQRPAELPIDQEISTRGTDPNARLEVERLLRSLQPEERFILLLLDGEGWSVAEIAQRLGWTKVNVKVRAHRARKKLRRLLEEEGGP